MVNMRDVHAAGQVQIKLNLRRKEIEIQFPLTIDKQNHKFSFRLSISQLSCIYKIENGQDSSSMIIPFGRAPQFFVHKKPTMGDASLFPEKERTWNAWNLMFRETNVTNGRTRREIQRLPLLDGKDEAIIDIGKTVSICKEPPVTNPLGRWTTYRLTFGPNTLSGP